MKFFVDTANVEDIRKANDMGVICGVTTNPSLIAKEGFQLPTSFAYPAGIIFAAVCLGTFVFTCVLGKGKNAEAGTAEEAYSV